MPLILPDFKDPNLVRFSTCVSTTDAAVIAQYRGVESFELDAKNASDQWYHSSFYILPPRGETPESMHLHLDGVRSFGSWKKPPSATIESICAAVNPLSGFTGAIWAKGDFQVPVETLPKNGMIAAMSGIKTSAGGDSLFLTGVTMAFEGELFDELEWKIEGENVTVALDLVGDECAVKDDVFLKPIELIEQGFQRLVLEKQGAANG